MAATRVALELGGLLGPELEEVQPPGAAVQVAGAVAVEALPSLGVTVTQAAAATPQVGVVVEVAVALATPLFCLVSLSGAVHTREGNQAITR